MKSLEFIKKHIKEWPSDNCSYITLTSAGRIVCGDEDHFDLDITIPTQKGASAYYDGIVWSREELEAFDASGRVSAVNRDIERGTIDAVLNERGSRYGKFKDGADIMQELKAVMRSTSGWGKLSPSQREALEMIQHKVGRILNGDPNYDDNWIDISGYSKLVADELNGESK